MQKTFLTAASAGDIGLFFAAFKQQYVILTMAENSARNYSLQGDGCMKKKK